MVGLIFESEPLVQTDPLLGIVGRYTKDPDRHLTLGPQGDSIGLSNGDTTLDVTLGALFGNVEHLRIITATDANSGLVAFIPGDGNLSGEVDAADYTIWANGFGLAGAEFTSGDFNGDGSANAADYTTWANNFGQSMGGPLPQAVPEPSAAVLLCIGCSALLGSRRRREMLSSCDTTLKCRAAVSSIQWAPMKTTADSPETPPDLTPRPAVDLNA